MRNERRLQSGICAVMAGLSLVFLLLSCGTRAESDSSGPAVMRDTTLIFYGDKTDRMSEFMSKNMPEFLRQKNININIDLQVLSWGDYAGSQVELRYASGEDFATMTDMGFMARCIAKGYILDITDLIEKYGASLKQEIEKASFDAFSFNGRNYALPLGNKPNASEWFAVTLRQDLLEEVGMKKVATIEDVERFYIESKKLHPDFVGWSGGSPSDTYGFCRMVSYDISEKNMLFLNELVFTDASADDDIVYSYFESEEFNKYAAIARRWNQMGIIDQQVASDGTIVGSKFNVGQALFRNGNAGLPWEEIHIVRNSVPTAKLKSYFIGNSKGRPRVSRGTYSTGFQVSSNAKYPDAYIEIFNQLYADRESYDFMSYGVEGVDYTLDGNGKFISRSTGQIFINDWASNLASKWLRFNNDIDDDIIYDYQHWNDGAILQKDIGFIFDLEPVKVEYAQIQSVISEYVPPIAMGFAEYNRVYPELLRRLKNAGIDKYMVEYQRQFSAFYKK
jgi:putative aldouronate transport system substrate-binding protein